MDLWVGNATRQRYEFRYKLPGVENFRVAAIEPGRQVKISDLTREEIDYIISKHQKYGIIPQEEIDRGKAFHGTCYSIDKMITHTRLIYLMDHNLSELVSRGREIRHANAIAQSMNVDRALEEAARPERVYGLDLTIQQENHDPNNDVPQLSVGTSVTNDESRTPPTQGRPRRKAA